jgi:hypothetical protein
VSAHTIAIELGWIVRPARLGSGSDNAKKRREFEIQNLVREGLLDAASVELGFVEKMELAIGVGNLGSVFSSEEERRQAWLMAKHELLARAQPGKRPWAWWRYEAPGLGLKYDCSHERSVLWRAGLLSETERAALEVEWLDEWGRCTQRNFMISRPFPDEPITGEAAKRRHLEWCDCPAELAEMWDAGLKAGSDKEASPG